MKKIKYIGISFGMFILSGIIGYLAQEYPCSFFLISCEYSNIPIISIIGFGSAAYIGKLARDDFDKKHYFVRFWLLGYTILSALLAIVQALIFVLSRFVL